MLYKYKSLENFKNFVDIVINQRIYAANYKELNDPMEGQYIHSTQFNKAISEAIWNEKQKIRILSLSKNENMPLMWSHYANGHRGVVIGVEIDENEYEVRPIDYSEYKFYVENNLKYPHDITAVQILSQKHKVWEYEEEVRVFIKDGTQYVKVIVKEIIIGSKMSNQDFSLVKKLLEMIDLDVKIKRADTEGYNYLF